jgi:glycosyltransferase involved in cell wall biosynthesis
MEDAALDVLLTPPPPLLRVAWITSWEVRCGVAEYGRQLLQAIPELPKVASHVLLTDERWQDDARPPDALAHAVHACWRIGDPASLPALEATISAEDPHAVVIQHQPGLMLWDTLAALLDGVALRGRTTVVTLHNTQHLLEQDEPARAGVGAALARADRVFVHTLADLERLRTLGLDVNVAVIPHGVKAHAPVLASGPTASPIIGCYGFFLPGKGIGELIRALAILRRTVPDARLRLVNAEYGTPESAAEIALCRAVAEEVGVTAAIEWHTAFLPAEEALALLAGCTVVALPTQTSKESSSASVRDALAAGPTVMVTPLHIYDDVGDTVVRAGGTDPASLAATLAAILGGTARPTREAARTWIAARSWDVVAARFWGTLIGLSATRPLASDASAP